MSYYVTWGYMRGHRSGFETFDAALAEYTRHRREYEVAWKARSYGATPPAIYGDGAEEDSDALTEDEREAVELA
jgi:hypothetical protein